MKETIMTNNIEGLKNMDSIINGHRKKDAEADIPKVKHLKCETLLCLNICHKMKSES